MVSELPLPVLHQYSENQQQVFYLSKAAKVIWFPAKLIEFLHQRCDEINQ